MNFPPQSLIKQLSSSLQKQRGPIDYQQIATLTQQYVYGKVTYDSSQQLNSTLQQQHKLQQDLNNIQRAHMECQLDRQEYHQKFTAEQEKTKFLNSQILKQAEEIGNLKLDLETATKMHNEMQSRINSLEHPQPSSQYQYDNFVPQVVQNPKMDLRNVETLQKQLAQLEQQYFKLQVDNEQTIYSYQTIKKDLELHKINEQKLKNQLDEKDQQIVKQDMQIQLVQQNLQASVLKARSQEELLNQQSLLLMNETQKLSVVNQSVSAVQRSTSNSPTKTKFVFKTPPKVPEEPKPSMSITSPTRKEYMVVVNTDNLAHDIYDIQEEIKDLNIASPILQRQLKDIIKTVEKYISSDGFDEVFKLLGYSSQDIKDFQSEWKNVHEYEYQARQNILGLWEPKVENQITEFLDKKLRQVEIAWPENTEITNPNRISVKLGSSLFLAFILGFQLQWKEDCIFPDLKDMEQLGSGITIKGW